MKLRVCLSRSLFKQKKDLPIGLGVAPLPPRKKKKEHHQEERECSSKVMEGATREDLNLLQVKGDKDQAVGEDHDIEMKCVKKSVSDSKSEKPNQAEPRYRFTNRRRSGSSLHLSSNIIQSLRKGKSLQLYNPTSGSYMVVCFRVANFTKEGTKGKTRMQGGPVSDHSLPNREGEADNPILALHESEDLLMESEVAEFTGVIRKEIAASRSKLAQMSPVVSSNLPASGCLSLASKESRGRGKRSKIQSRFGNSRKTLKASRKIRSNFLPKFDVMGKLRAGMKRKPGFLDDPSQRSRKKLASSSCVSNNNSDVHNVSSSCLKLDVLNGATEVNDLEKLETQIRAVAGKDLDLAAIAGNSSLEIPEVPLLHLVLALILRRRLLPRFGFSTFIIPCKLFFDLQNEN
ncbi:hypothetical protein BVRB_2g037600 [Beta vulgaris subsp. vulgaris]|nr:hypothetical protein BVRB_2g037600 [Beta vulgaris subsp. vulgaris]